MKRYTTLILMAFVSVLFLGVAIAEEPYDLVQKNRFYGLEDLSAIPNQFKSNAPVYFVDGASSNASDVADRRHGESWIYPYDTVDWAIDLMTTGGGVILVAPGHTESVVSAGDWALDVAGVTLLGKGNRDNRPVITADTLAAASIKVTAENVTIDNFTFVCGVSLLTHLIDIGNAANLTIRNCSFIEGTVGGTVDANGLTYITADGTDADADNLLIDNCEFYARTVTNWTSAIELAKDFTGVTIRNCSIYGDFSDACIEIPTAGNAQVGLLIDNCILVNTETGQHALEVIGTASKGTVRNTTFSTDGTYVDMGGLVDGGGCKTVDYSADSDTISYGSYTPGAGSITSTVMATDSIGADELAADALAEIEAEVQDALQAEQVDHIAGVDTTVAADGDLTTYIADGSGLAHIMSATANTSTYKATTDSLEAISVALNSTLALDNLAVTADGGSNAYPDSVVQESILAYLMSKSANPVATSFNNTTDSLEALRDFMAAGTGVTTAIDADNLDHLASTDTGVAADGDLGTAFVLAGSILGHIMAADADPTTSYNASTDSLEAISVALAAGTGASTALAAANLDELASATTGIALDADASSKIVNASALAHIMGADATTVTYDASTDSLEAISVALAAGTGSSTALAAVNLDELTAVTTGIAADADPSTKIVAGSVFAHIMGNDATTNDYDASTDSLEAIGDRMDTINTADQIDIDAILADTISISGATLPADPTANSLAAFIASGGTGLGTELADSKSLVDAIGTNGTTVADTATGIAGMIGVDDADNAMATTSVVANPDGSVFERLEELQYWQEKTITWNETLFVSDDAFVVAGGPILITNLVGIITTAYDGALTRTWWLDATTAAQDVEFTDSVDIDAYLVGSRIFYSSANPALITNIAGAGANLGSTSLMSPWFCPIGTIEVLVEGPGATAGAITWYMTYKPLTTGVTVTAQ